jgi:hypothetical protein
MPLYLYMGDSYGFTYDVHRFATKALSPIAIGHGENDDFYSTRTSCLGVPACPGAYAKASAPACRQVRGLYA